MTTKEAIELLSKYPDDTIIASLVVQIEGEPEQHMTAVSWEMRKRFDPASIAA